MVAVLALVASSCGARVGPYLGVTGAGTPSGQASPGVAGVAGAAAGPGGQLGAAATPASASGGHSGAQAGGSAPAPAPGSGGGNGSGFNFDPAAEAAACPAGAGNSASAPGVTAASVTVGNVSGMTGTVGNLFPQGPESVQALFSAINAHGGICGRKLVLSVEDDGQDSSHHAADIADLAPKVLAFVGSTSDADNGGVSTMAQAGTPDIGFAINPQRCQGSSVYFSSSGCSEYEQNGRPYGWNTLENGLVQYHLAPKKLALLAYNVPVSSYGAGIYGYGFQHYAGSSICFTDESISPATASLDQDVLEMKARGCDGIFSLMDVTGNAKLLQAMSQQDYHPGFVASTGAAYSQDLIDLAGGSAANGFELYTWFYPLDSSNAMMKMYQSQMATYEPGKTPNFFGVLAWADAQMFVYSLIHAGRNPTRASLSAQLNALSDWDTGGLMSPTTPKLRETPGKCMVELVVKDGQWTRKWPSSDLYCNGQLVPLG